MKTQEFQKMLRKAVISYAADAPEYEQVMDQINAVCSDEQWERVKEALRGH